MQSWANRGSHCLSCAIQPLFRSGIRTFSTTSALQRSKRLQKSKKAQEAAQTKPDNSPARPSLRSATKNLRQNVTAPDFSIIVATLLKELKKELSQSSESALSGWQRFERYVMNACKLEDRATSGGFGTLRQVKTTLQKTYIQSGVRGLKNELEYLLYAEDVTSKYSTPNIEQQKKVADMRFPAEWYPQARSIQRTIHLHVGPTNSGKTYQALKKLEASKSGFYAGPLRLLAQEVYHRFQANGTTCSLVTGDDVKIPEGQAPTIVSNTVEMVNLGQPYDVGVIDEIQMIGDPKRGWAWTRAVLGARAKERR